MKIPWITKQTPKVLPDEWSAAFGVVQAVRAYLCDYDPVSLLGRPIGMFHCPLCGSMQIAGIPHISNKNDLADALAIYDYVIDRDRG